LDQESIQPGGFIKEAEGPMGVFCVFEDDGETGYLYIYKPNGGIVRHLHVYDRSILLPIGEQDVRVEWSVDLTKCGVFIWDKMRGIIYLASEREGRVWLENRDTPGIGDLEWLKGFPSRG
jgi:hypothetical protein